MIKQGERDSHPLINLVTDCLSARLLILYRPNLQLYKQNLQFQYCIVYRLKEQLQALKQEMSLLPKKEDITRSGKWLHCALK